MTIIDVALNALNDITVPKVRLGSDAFATFTLDGTAHSISVVTAQADGHDAAAVQHMKITQYQSGGVVELRRDTQT